MKNMAEAIEKVADGEPIEAVVIGATDSWTEVPEIEEAFERTLTPDDLFRVLTWAEARPMLDVDYDNGYGGADCQPLYAWTATRVLQVHEYDGSTWVGSVPRHPVEGVRPSFA